MNFIEKKCLKKTTHLQFKTLVDQMEEFPQLATGAPSFGLNKSIVEQMWENVSEKVNAFGPPVRSGQEWKKVWHDLKCRLKRKISENKKSLHGTGGGPCSISCLTELEVVIDRICHLSSAAAPPGNVLGIYNAKTSLNLTPPRSKNPHQKNTSTPQQQQNTIETSPLNIGDIIVYSPQKNIFTLGELPKSSKQSAPTQPSHQNKKRKYEENAAHKNEVLRQQIELQRETIEIMRKQAEASVKNAEAARLQAEAAKIQAETLKDIAISVTAISQALTDIVNHIKDDF